jgi:hypothetical protein
MDAIDALWDSITAGGINKNNPPFRIHITGSNETPRSCKDVLDRFVALIAEARDQGVEVDVVCR